MLARFGFVDDMVTSKFQVHANTPMDDRSGHLNYIPSGPVAVDGRDEFDYRLIVNTYLEHGQGYDRVCEALGLLEEDLDFDFFSDYDEKPEDMAAVDKVLHHVGQDYVVFYYGAEVDNTIGGLNRDEIWKPEDWNRLGRMVHEEFGLKIVVIGAPYDTSYANRILGANRDTFYYNAIGELDITETLALIQRSKFVVAFPAGVGIVGPYMRVPTVIFWRPKHMSYHVMHDRAGFRPEFATNWVPEPVLKAGGYYPAWYGEDTPDTIMEAVRKGGWAKRTPTTPIGKWKH
jgi:ADP-heptose:LPS heptosyltransferase